jgi:hypothetical protein
VIKLYKRVDGRLQYHEAWLDESVITEHWGTVGDRGSSREHPASRRKSEKAALREVLKSALDSGYEAIDDEQTSVVLIEYEVDGFGTTADLEKRHALESRMNETLGWTGVGHCDGGSIGSGSMEVCCIVVDADIAKRVIEDDLKGTEFSDYSRICQESGAQND